MRLQQHIEPRQNTSGCYLRSPKRKHPLKIVRSVALQHIILQLDLHLLNSNPSALALHCVAVVLCRARDLELFHKLGASKQASLHLRSIWQ